MRIETLRQDEGRYVFDVFEGDRRLGRIESELVRGKRGVYHGRTLEAFDIAGRSLRLFSSLEQALDYFTEIANASAPTDPNRYLKAAASAMGDLPIGSYDHGHDDAADDAAETETHHA